MTSIYHVVLHQTDHIGIKVAGLIPLENLQPKHLLSTSIRTHYTHLSFQNTVTANEFTVKRVIQLVKNNLKLATQLNPSKIMIADNVIGHANLIEPGLEARSD